MPGKQGKKAGPKKKGLKNKGELVIVTGLSGSGKLSALKAFEDLGFYSVDNLPLDLVPQFADLVRQSHEARAKARQLLDEAKQKVEELIESKS